MRSAGWPPSETQVTFQQAAFTDDSRSLILRCAVRPFLKSHPFLLGQGNLVNLGNCSSHLQRDKYGDFVLTEAIRPSLDLRVIPQEGYRIDTYRDDEHNLRVPVLAASVSRERLFDAFLALLQPLTDVVDVVLETSHQSEHRHHDIFREHIDLPVLISHFCDFEDLLTHDGCTGVAVISLDEPIEVQFDEHKLLMVYAGDLGPFEKILRGNGLRRKDHMQLITEATHFHNSLRRHLPAFEQLCYRLGVGEAAEPVNG
jgi:hypothetical protein